MRLSESQSRALLYMAEDGALERQTGGYWTRPGVEDIDRYVSTLTIYALEMRKLVKPVASLRANWTRVEITDAGRAMLKDIADVCA